MLILVAKAPSVNLDIINDILTLTAEERQRSFYRCTSVKGQEIKLNLKRGTTLKNGDVLMSARDETGQIAYIQIKAKPEPVITVTASEPLHLLQAAYHLGNRHIALEIQPTYLRLSPDSVLQAMLEQMPVNLTEEIVPFHPEAGAYRHGHT